MQLDEMIDDVAERIRTIGHYVTGSLKEFLSLTSLTEKTNNSNDSRGNIKDLLSDHQSIIVKIREAIYSKDGKMLDLGTSDFLTGLMASHEKMAWMLSASLK
jgi:starvation-inducible DNA-binding protein